MNKNLCSNYNIHMLFEDGFKLYNTQNEPPCCLHDRKRKALQVAALTDHFTHVFIFENVAHGYDVLMTL